MGLKNKKRETLLQAGDGRHIDVCRGRVLSAFWGWHPASWLSVGIGKHQSLELLSRDRPRELSKVVAVPCVSVLVSDLLLHLSVCEGFQERAPLVSVPRVTNCDLHGRQRVLAAGQGRATKQHPSEHSPGSPARPQAQGQQSIIYSVSGFSIPSALCLVQCGSLKFTTGSWVHPCGT